MCGCANMQMGECADVQMGECADVQMCKWVNLQMCKWVNLQMCKCANMQMSNCSEPILDYFSHDFDVVMIFPKTLSITTTSSSNCVGLG